MEETTEISTIFEGVAEQVRIENGSIRVIYSNGQRDTSKSVKITAEDNRISTMIDGVFVSGIVFDASSYCMFHGCGVMIVKTGGAFEVCIRYGEEETTEEETTEEEPDYIDSKISQIETVEDVADCVDSVQSLCQSILSKAENIGMDINDSEHLDRFISMGCEFDEIKGELEDLGQEE